MASRLNNISPELHAAYSDCVKMAHSHYENFPVASRLLPQYLRRSVAAIYTFARTADDIADEGNYNREQRLEKMTRFEANLYDIQYGKPPSEALFMALKHTVESFNLPIQLFYDLLTAFRQDILKNRYQNFSEVHDYCHYSANPVGRLLLHLSGQATEHNLQLSDNICTGLQLINFIQDVEIDICTKDRCYIPMDELAAFELNISDIKSRLNTDKYRELIDLQVKRAETIYNQGLNLSNNLPGFFGFEIRYIIACGQRVIQKLQRRKNIYQRPRMHKVDLIWLFFSTLFTKPITPTAIDPLLEQL